MSHRELSKKQMQQGAAQGAGHRCLLIVDDDPRVCRALLRRLNGSFDALFTASTLEEANRRLDSEAVTHLICDHYLGDGIPSGTTLVERWRREHRSIERAVLFTGGTMDDTAKPVGLDAIVIKTTDASDLMRALGLTDPWTENNDAPGRRLP